MMNQTLATIFNRKSVRAYSDSPVSEETLELLAKAGMAAPSAVDKRPWQFVLVSDRKVLEQLADALPYAKMTAHAGGAVIVIGDIYKQNRGPDTDYWLVDCSAATENILLAAESLGLGAVWTAVYPDPARIGPVRKILGIPDHMIPLNLIPVGYPAHDEHPKEKFDSGLIHWNRW